MRIADFESFIREIPFEYQSFDINHKFWKNLSQSAIIDRIFDGSENITISRFDLFNSGWDIEEFILKLLMWGFPTKGRGKNIDNLLLPENFGQLIAKLKLHADGDNLSLSEVQDFLKIKGLGFSTLTKILYFKKLRVESCQSLILDQRVINALSNERKFKDSGIDKFNMLRYASAVRHYVNYLVFMNELALQMKVLPDQVEMFLFEFGSNLKEPMGEDGAMDLDE